MKVKNRKLVCDHSCVEFTLSYRGAVLHDTENVQVRLELCEQT